jgi:hypothetical protein
MDFFFFASKYFWVAGIFMTLLNAIVFKARSKSYVKQWPERRVGYEKLIRGYLLFGIPPWLLMGAGIMFGGVPSVFSYFDPRHGNLFVLLFHFMALIIWGFAFYWIIVGQGAEFLAAHPTSAHPHIVSPKLVRLFMGVLLIGSIVAEVMMWANVFPPMQLSGQLPSKR